MQNYDLTNINTVISGNPPLEDTSAEIMAELLMDDNYSTYRMFERIATKYVNNPELRDGIDFTLKELVGYNTTELAKKIVDYNLEHASKIARSEYAVELYDKKTDLFRSQVNVCQSLDEAKKYIEQMKSLEPDYASPDEYYGVLRIDYDEEDEEIDVERIELDEIDTENIDWQIVSYISGNTLDIPANNPNIVKSYIDGYVNDINPQYDSKSIEIEDI